MYLISLISIQVIQENCASIRAIQESESDVARDCTKKGVLEERVKWLHDVFIEMGGDCESTPPDSPKETKQDKPVTGERMPDDGTGQAQLVGTTGTTMKNT